MFPPAMPNTMSMPASSSTWRIASAARVSVVNSLLAVVIKPAPLSSLLHSKSGSRGHPSRCSGAEPRFAPVGHGVSHTLSPFTRASLHANHRFTQVFLLLQQVVEVADCVTG